MLTGKGKRMASMVYLVGAGGRSGTCHSQGTGIDKKADCIIYDRLSSPELLGYAGMDCERIYVGKALASYASAGTDQ